MHHISHVISRQLSPIQTQPFNASRSGPNASRKDECACETITAPGKCPRWYVEPKARPINPLKQYQQELFTELRAEDELVVLARGLGLLHLIANLLHFYDAAGNNLVLVVGADDRENEWLGEGMYDRSRARLCTMNIY